MVRLMIRLDFAFVLHDEIFLTNFISQEFFDYVN